MPLVREFVKEVLAASQTSASIPTKPWPWARPFKPEIIDGTLSNMTLLDVAPLSLASRLWRLDECAHPAQYDHSLQGRRMFTNAAANQTSMRLHRAAGRTRDGREQLEARRI